MSKKRTQYSSEFNASEYSADDLHRLIGQLTVERDFLARKLDH